MLKKVDDDFAKPEEGDALVEQCVTSVTTDRTHGRDRRRHRRLAIEPRRQEGRPRQDARQASARRRSSRRSWRRWSTRCRRGNDWLHEYKYDGYRLLIATAGGAATAWTRNGNDWSDKFRADRSRRVEAARRLPDRRRGGGARQEGQAQLPAAAGDAEGRRRRPRLLCLRPAGRPGRGHHADCPTSSARSGSRRCSRPSARRSSMATMSSARARPCSTPSARRAARGSSRRRPRRPIGGARTQQLAQDQMHPAPGIRHRRLAGERQAPGLPLAPPRPCARAAS